MEPDDLRENGGDWTEVVNSTGWATRKGSFRAQVPNLPPSTCGIVGEVFVLPESLFAPTSNGCQSMHVTGMR